jgi:GNAT superfamily N-acetyltransferase
MSSDLIARAAANNIHQSEAVLEALGSRGKFTDDLWTNPHLWNIPYANGGTLSVGGDEQRQLDEIAQLTSGRPAGVATYVMDSWAVLDLTPLGYEIHFTDEWYVLRKPVTDGGQSGGERVRPIVHPDDLAEFDRASVLGFDVALPSDPPGHTFAPSLLDDGRFQFLGLYVDGALASGLYLFDDSDSTGVYTFFTLPRYRGRGHATELLRTALQAVSTFPLATNPSPLSRGIFAKLGFQPIGERRLWRRT